MSNIYHKIGRKIISGFRRELKPHIIEYEATFDDGSKATYVENRQLKSASRKPRWVDYVINNEFDVPIQENEESTKDS